jgi:hypothetical protein
MFWKGLGAVKMFMSEGRLALKREK